MKYKRNNIQLIFSQLAISYSALSDWAIDWKLCADIVKCVAIGFTGTIC